jgi:uncharacterized protein YcnI
MSRNTLRRVGAVVGAATAVLVATALPASAHVTVNPKEATQGGFAKLSFRVPNERDKATTKVEVVFPEKQPLSSVSTRPVPGWKAEVTKTKLAKPIKVHDREVTEAVSKVTWTAESPATAVQVGQFQEFDVSAGPLPEGSDTMVFKALQTYADGQVVRWIEEPSGSSEPEHPAPVLKLVKGDDGHGANTSNAAAGDATAEADDDEHEGGGNALGIAGLVAGLAGLALGGFALFRTRKTS